MAGKEHPTEDGPAPYPPQGREGMTVEMVIGGIEVVSHPNDVEKKNNKASRRKPIGRNAYGKEGYIACYYPAAEIARVEQ